MEVVGRASLDFSGHCRLAAQAMLQTVMEDEATAQTELVVQVPAGDGLPSPRLFLASDC